MSFKLKIGFLLILVFFGFTIPPVQVKNVKGQLINSSEIINKDGKATVILFWATWCHPCLKELETINELLPEWQEQYDFNLIAVSVDDARTTNRVPAFVNGKAWDLEVFLDANGDFKRALNVVNVPTSLIISPEGDVIYNHTSYSPGDEEGILKILEAFPKK